MLDNVLINGITDLESYPPSDCTRYCKQCIQSNFLYLPDKKPDIESIDEIKVSVCVEDFEVFKTILGPKLLLNGIKKIKILYTANNCQQSLHSAHWCIPFCEFILLKNMNYNKCFNGINDIFIGVENVCIKQYNRRGVDVSLLFIICPEFKMNCFDNCKKSKEDCKKDHYCSRPSSYEKNNDNHYCE